MPRYPFSLSARFCKLCFWLFLNKLIVVDVAQILCFFAIFFFLKNVTVQKYKILTSNSWRHNGCKLPFLLNTRQFYFCRSQSATQTSEVFLNAWITRKDVFLSRTNYKSYEPSQVLRKMNIFTFSHVIFTALFSLLRIFHGERWNNSLITFFIFRETRTDSDTITISLNREN